MVPFRLSPSKVFGRGYVLRGCLAQARDLLTIRGLSNFLSGPGRPTVAKSTGKEEVRELCKYGKPTVELVGPGREPVL